jgi:hypothetical protein
MPLDLGGYIIDSQTVGEKMKKPHHTARAGLAHVQQDLHRHDEIQSSSDQITIDSRLQKEASTLGG